MTPIGFDEDRYAPANSTDLLPLPTECAMPECTRDRVHPDYPMCIVHAAFAHYRDRDYCLCISCKAKRDLTAKKLDEGICCEEKVWGNPCNCAGDAIPAAA